MSNNVELDKDICIGEAKVEEKKTAPKRRRGSVMSKSPCKYCKSKYCNHLYCAMWTRWFYESLNQVQGKIKEKGTVSVKGE